MPVTFSKSPITLVVFGASACLGPYFLLGEFAWIGLVGCSGVKDLLIGAFAAFGVFA
jgi:hypothetical protein